MPAQTLLRAARDAGLIDDARHDALAAWVAERHPTPQELADEFVRVGGLRPVQVAELAAGRGNCLTLGAYRLLDVIGEGGMGRVYRATQARSGRLVAVKVVRRDHMRHAGTVERFHQEIRAAARLKHPNVVLVFDADEADGVHFAVMELVEGTDLAATVKALGPVPVPLACDYIRQAALGLQHAADRNLIHRDVKPGNLLVTPQGRVKVLDLGLAKTHGEAAEPGQRRVIVGTPDYLAPEQARDSDAIDCRADVYSLGATLFFLLTGRQPFAGGTARDKIRRHLAAPPPSARELRPDLPPDLDALIRGMMAKSPDDRPTCPGHVAALLAPYCPAVLIAAPPVADAVPALDAELIAATADAPLRLRRPAGRYRGPAAGRGRLRPLAVGVLLLAGVGAALAISSLFAPKAEAELAGRFTNSLGMTMVRLPGGAFDMGSPDEETGREADEGPVRRVEIAGPFYIAATEVTHGQFLALTGRAPSVTARKAREPGKCPVDNVSCPDAVEFCRILTERERDRRLGWAYRLPTEVEWEYACRAGTSTPFSAGERLQCGADAVFRLLEHDPLGVAGEGVPERQQRQPSVSRPVGATRPNPWGLFDLHGNVWEWCGNGIVRGGAWDEPAARCRSASRRVLAPASAEARGNVGFRVVFAPEGTQ